MFKKFLLFITVFTIGVLLTACTEDPVSDSEYIRDIRDTITFDSFEVSDSIVIPEITDETVTVSWVSSNPDYLDIDGTVVQPHYLFGNQSISLTLSIEKGDDVVTKVFEFTIIAEDRPENIVLTTPYTDELTLTEAYSGKSFETDGIGEVSLNQCVDGDTAHFTDGTNNYTVRFLGIDTPESTAKFEPWGKAASSFTCDKLTNAQTIVLQADSDSTRHDNYGRYLAWVWYDGRLLNLELVELAYSKAKVSANLLYGDEIIASNLYVQLTEKRVWGETDPDFDYSIDGVQVTIEELVTNHAEYEAEKVSITGYISAVIGGAVYIQQGNYGIFLYYNQASPHLQVGNEVRLSGLNLTYYPDKATGAPQLVNYSATPEKSELLSTGNVVTPQVVAISELTDTNIGSLLKFEDLTITSIYTGTDSFTLTVEDDLGNELTIRKDSDVKFGLNVSQYSVGDVIDVVGPLAKYQGEYQLNLTIVPTLNVNQLDDAHIYRMFDIKKLEILSIELQTDGSTIITVLDDDGDDDTSNDNLSTLRVIVPNGSDIDLTDTTLFTVGNQIEVMGQLLKDESGYKIISYYIE